MELRNLRAFVEVVRRGSFSHAAKVVFSTQSTVSKAVKQLEDELGLPLLDRNGRRSRLTDAGQIVYRRALSMLAESEDLLVELADLRALNRGSLRLGLPAIGSSILFAPSFAVYRRLYPNIDIQLFEHGSKRLEELVMSGEIELAVSLLPVSKEFEWQAISYQPLHLLISSAHAFATRDSVTLDALRRLSFILFETGFALNAIILRACKYRGFVPTITARSSQIDFIVELVAANLGIAFLPKMIAETLTHPEVRHLPIKDPNMNWNLALTWRRGGYLSDAARAWKSLVLEMLHPRAFPAKV
jgi:DNA-binding transcriptional LysR family regulator